VRKTLGIAVLALAVAAGACSKDEADSIPPPHALAGDATGHYCGMLLAEHPGPKGQILLKSAGSPVWFSSVRDTLTFLVLPEEPKDVAAVYVSDMAKAPAWDDPGDGNWVPAATAFFVVGSDRQGGMGGAEAVPFSTEEAAQAFIRDHRGRVVGFDEAKTLVAASPGG
jgi:copper chaperone NosL